MSFEIHTFCFFFSCSTSSLTSFLFREDCCVFCFFWSSSCTRYFCLAPAAETCSCLLATSTLKMPPTALTWSQMILLALNVFLEVITFNLFIDWKSSRNWCLSMWQQYDNLNYSPQLCIRWVVCQSVMKKFVNLTWCLIKARKLWDLWHTALNELTVLLYDTTERK